MKILKKMNIYLLLIFIFIIIIFSVVFSTAFFSNSTNIEGNITLKELDFSIYGDADENITVMPGDSTRIDCYIINSRDIDGINYDNLTNIYIRFNLSIKSNNNPIKFEITEENNDFIQINDTYYYTKEILPGEIIKIIKNINFDTEIDNSFNGKDIDFELTVEAIQSTNNAVSELWPEFSDYLNIKE